MNYCCNCKYYGELSRTCVNSNNVLKEHKYLKDPITGNNNRVDCKKFNAKGNCNEYKDRPENTFTGFMIFTLIVILSLIILGIVVSILLWGV